MATDGKDARDDGADRDARVRPCPKHAWCVEETGHEGVCMGHRRFPIPPSDYGPKRNKR